MESVGSKNFAYGQRIGTLVAAISGKTQDENQSDDFNAVCNQH